MRFNALLIAMVGTAVLLPSEQGMAASFKVTAPYYMGDRLNSATIQVLGEIQVGDLAKLEQVLSPIDGYAEGFWDGGTVLALDSPGGSYPEGIRIGRLIREKGIGTRVSANAECYSACAIIFMHGTSKADGDEWLNRSLHPKAQLGFHAPYLVLPEDIVPSREMVEASYAAAMVSVASLIESAGRIFSEELLMKMLITPPDAMLMVETFGDLHTWRIALDGSERPLASLTYAQMVMACEIFDATENDLRPIITSERADEIVRGGHGPVRLGISSSQDEVYRFSLNDLNSVGCNLGVGRNNDGSLRIRYYGASYGNDPMPDSYSWLLERTYFSDPTSRFSDE